MARDFKPRNYSDIDSPDFKKLTEGIKFKNSEQVRERILFELSELGKNTLTRIVIVEKYKYVNPRYANRDKKSTERAYRELMGRISNLVEKISPFEHPIGYYSPKPSDNVQLDTSNVKTQEEEMLEYYISSGANIELF